MNERIKGAPPGLRVGERIAVRGGARVRTVADVEAGAPPPSPEAASAVGEAELAAAGDLLAGRVVEVNLMSQEPVVSKQAVVREELVVSKTVRQRTERIDETLRRTEAEVEAIDGH